MQHPAVDKLGHSHSPTCWMDRPPMIAAGQQHVVLLPVHAMQCWNCGA